jgi:hypothetical protein
VSTTLVDVLRESETDPFLLQGPPAPNAGWVYRDFRPMPQNFWLELLEFIGLDNIQVVACNPRQLPPAEMCRAQIWISPEAQTKWVAYLQEHAS